MCEWRTGRVIRRFLLFPLGGPCSSACLPFLGVPLSPYNSVLLFFKDFRSGQQLPLS